MNGFPAELGDPNNANNPGPLPDGRREINWDGGGPPVISGTPPVTPFTVFQNTRGATFTTPGTGLTQAADTGGLLSLDLINPQYADLFAPFSPTRLFTPIGSNITDGFFSIPGMGGAELATINLPSGGFIGTGPQLRVVVTNLDNSESVTLNIQGAGHVSFGPQGEVMVTVTGRNLLGDPVANTMLLAIGTFHFIPGPDNALLDLSGEGQLLDVCAMID